MDYSGVLVPCNLPLSPAWLPGDDRGWRSRRHKRHSSGDYKHPPPPDEHAGLLTYVKNRMTTPPVALQPAEPAIVGSAFVRKLQKMKCDVRILACGATHLHVLCRLTEPDAIRQLGKAKQYASYCLV